MRLTNLEFRACQLLLAAARACQQFDHMKQKMRREGISEQTWRRFYQKLGLMVLVSGEGDDAERYVYPPENLLPFAPRNVNKFEWPERPQLRSGGSAA
jgi:hypothetical protein